MMEVIQKNTKCLKVFLSTNTSILLICPALFLYIYSNEINLIGLNGLVYQKVCLNDYNQTICDLISNKSHLNNNYTEQIIFMIQKKTSQKTIYLNITFLFPAIVSLIYLASIGDRKLNYELPMILSVSGSLIQSFICIFIPNLQIQSALYFMLFSQFINGICGAGSLSFISSCFSHISINNNYNHSTKSISYSICESLILLGQFFGSLSSGYIIGNKTNMDNFRNNYIISFSIYFLVLIYLVIIFKFIYKPRKESKHDTDQLIQAENYPDSNSNFDLIKNKLTFVYDTWMLLNRKRENKGHFYLYIMLILYFFGASISLGIMSIQYLYLIKKPIFFSQINYGVFRALNTLFRSISLLIILPLIKTYFNVPDYYLFLIGLVSEFLNLIIFSISSYYSYLIWIGKVLLI